MFIELQLNLKLLHSFAGVMYPLELINVYQPGMCKQRIPTHVRMRHVGLDVR